MQPTSISDIKAKIDQEHDDYTVQFHISLSLHEYFRTNNIGILEIEPDVQSFQDNSPLKRPDLLFRSQKKNTILDVKNVKSSNPNTYFGRVSELEKYKGKIKLREQVIETQSIALCPLKTVENNPNPEDFTVIGFDIEDGNVTLGPIVGMIEDEELGNLFSGDLLTIPMNCGTEKFLKSEPQLAYVAKEVWNMIYAVGVSDYNNPNVKRVDLQSLKRALRSTYPDYLKTNTGDPLPQIANGRLDKALRFLHRNHWIEIANGRIELTKGRTASDPFEKFKNIQAMEEYQELTRKKRAKKRETKRKKALDDLLLIPQDLSSYDIFKP